MATYIGTNAQGRLIYEIEPEEEKVLFKNEPNTSTLMSRIEKLEGKIKTKTVSGTTTANGAINVNLSRQTNPVLNIIVTNNANAEYYVVLAGTTAGGQYAVIKKVSDNQNVAQTSISLLVIYMEVGD